MKLLVIGDIGIIFTYEYITEIASNFSNCHIDILNFSPRSTKYESREQKLRELGCTVYYSPQYKQLKRFKIFHPIIRIREALRYRICKDYDYIHIHFVGIDSWVVPFYAKSKARIIVSFYGSDLLRSTAITTFFQKIILRRADVITMANKYIQEQFEVKFGHTFYNKIALVRYGSVAAKHMHISLEKFSRIECKKENKLPLDRKIILCGYNGSPSQKHIEIIDEIKRLPPKYINDVYLVFHCSYGLSNDYYIKLAKHLKASGLDGRIVTEFMYGEHLAKFRKSIDIFLNLQPTDVLSASMIEELESGAIVVKGDWLHYPDLEERNVSIFSINSMKQLTNMLMDIIDSYENYYSLCASTNKGIWKILSWEYEYDKWKRVVMG